MSKVAVIFDLDDTLVKEIEYLKSAFREIAAFADAGNKTLFEELFQWYRNKENAFGRLIEKYGHLQLDDLKKMYRNHEPDFSEVFTARQLLEDLKKAGHPLGLMTDGFSITQRNKIKALGLEDFFDKVVISEEFGSEKPSEANFRAFMELPASRFVYVGDNLKKDFVTAKTLGWTTICLKDNGANIHPQDFNRPEGFLPTYCVDSLDELPQLINKL